MSRAERRITELLATAGITVNGCEPWDIHVRDEGFYSRVLRGRSVGLGESYMDGWWGCDRLDELFHRLLRTQVDVMAGKGVGALVDLVLDAVINRQTRVKSNEVKARHYELGNDLFTSFLDAHNQYSCGFFAGDDDLDQAQRRKLDLIINKLELKPTDRLLDIGCGWGGLALYASENYGCRVTGINISGKQLNHAQRLCRNKRLPVELVQCDYRDLNGIYDKVVSVGMFEHVGYKNYRRFMDSVSRCLESHGIFLLHTIGSNVSVIGCDSWIRKYIFPNGMLPSLAQISRAAEGLFVIEDVHNLGPHYDRTLLAWNDRFQANWLRLKEIYPAQFKRMWEYYLLSCAGAFRARVIQVWQIVMTKTGRVQPDCRPHYG